MLFGKALAGVLVAAAFAVAEDEPTGTTNPLANRVEDDYVPATHIIKVGPVSAIVIFITCINADDK